jgi:hypothetical protein
MQKNAMNKQKGMTTIGWIIMIAFIGFNGLVAINVAPVYFTDSNVKSLWRSLETDTTLIGLSPKKLRQSISKRLRVNNVYDIKKDDIKIKKSKGFHIVSLEYEPRGKIVGSLDYIITFKHEAKVRAK